MTLFTLPLLEQKMVYVEPLGIYVEPKKSRVDRRKIFTTLTSGKIILSDGISEESFNEQCRYVTIDDVIKGLSYDEADEYAGRNGRRLLKRREWYIAKKFMEERYIENDMSTGLWELTGSLTDFSDDSVIIRERERELHLPLRGGYVLTADDDGFPSEIQTKAEIFGPVLKPYYLLSVGRGESGVIVCAGNFAYEQLRDLSLLVVPVSYKHPFISFRLCSDSEPSPK